MNMGIREFYRLHRLQLPTVIAVFALGVVIASIIAVVMTMPPRVLTMATGPEGGSYHEFGKQYREILAREGVTLRLEATSGAIENLAKLKDPESKVDVGFLQGGLTSKTESPGLESLGTVFYEPLWIFHRDLYQGKGRLELLGKRISGGPAVPSGGINRFSPQR
jgi:TRAP-type uncharacterized transport system substrate-binding protein